MCVYDDEQTLEYGLLLLPVLTFISHFKFLLIHCLHFKNKRYNSWFKEKVKSMHDKHWLMTVRAFSSLQSQSHSHQ
jgi:hypothetical protein